MIWDFKIRAPYTIAGTNLRNKPVVLNRSRKLKISKPVKHSAYRIILVLRSVFPKGNRLFTISLITADFFCRIIKLQNKLFVKHGDAVFVEGIIKSNHAIVDKVLIFIEIIRI